MNHSHRLPSNTAAPAGAAPRSASSSPKVSPAPAHLSASSAPGRKSTVASSSASKPSPSSKPTTSSGGGGKPATGDKLTSVSPAPRPPPRRPAGAPSTVQHVAAPSTTVAGSPSIAAAPVASKSTAASAVADDASRQRRRTRPSLKPLLAVDTLDQSLGTIAEHHNEHTPTNERASTRSIPGSDPPAAAAGGEASPASAPAPRPTVATDLVLPFTPPVSPGKPTSPRRNTVAVDALVTRPARRSPSHFFTDDCTRGNSPPLQPSAEPQPPAELVLPASAPAPASASVVATGTSSAASSPVGTPQAALPAVRRYTAGVLGVGRSRLPSLDRLEVSVFARVDPPPRVSPLIFPRWHPATAAAPRCPSHVLLLPEHSLLPPAVLCCLLPRPSFDYWYCWLLAAMHADAGGNRQDPT